MYEICRMPQRNWDNPVPCLIHLISSLEQQRLGVDREGTFHAMVEIFSGNSRLG